MRTPHARASALLVAVERFIREEQKHARIIERHYRKTGDPRADSAPTSRDAVDLAHADLMLEFTAADCREARALLRGRKTP